MIIVAKDGSGDFRSIQEAVDALPDTAEGEGARILVREGDIVIIPPMTPHSNASADGFQNIHINMVSPALSFVSPLVISDDSNHFLLDAFNAVFFHFYSDRKETAPLLNADEAAYLARKCAAIEL